MRKLMLVIFLLLVGLECKANAVTVTFNPIEIAPATISNGSAFTNQWSSFGITGQNMYWYSDSRDTFDSYGISLSQTVGVVVFGELVTLTIDYWTISGHSTTYSVYDSSNTLLDSLTVNATSGDVLGTYTFSGSDITDLELTGSPGYGQVSTLYYNQQPSQVPEPSALLLLGTGLAGIGFAAWRRKK